MCRVFKFSWIIYLSIGLILGGCRGEGEGGPVGVAQGEGAEEGSPIEGHQEEDLMKAESSQDQTQAVYHQGQGQGGPHLGFMLPQGSEPIGAAGFLQLPPHARPSSGHLLLQPPPKQQGGQGGHGGALPLQTNPFGGPPSGPHFGPQPVYQGGLPGVAIPSDNAIEYGPADMGQPVEYQYGGYESAGSHEIPEQASPPSNQQQPPPPPNNGYRPNENSVVPANEPWPLPAPDMPKISHLDVKCEKNLMKVAIEFDKPFNGIIFSKGHYSYANCVHLPANSNKNSVYFDVSINSCGTVGNTENGLYGYGQSSGSGTFFENTIVIQYDHQVQEVWDQARKLRCTWHDQYEKSVTFRPFPVDMLDVVRADFAGDNVGCWMQIQVGKGPWASEVAGIVKIGQTMTMVLAIKDEENKFDMLVRNCIAHDGKRAPIELVDSQGCIARPKLMSRFTKIKNFGSSATVLSYAHFQAFKFPDSMEVHFQCTIQICRNQCPEQCNANPQPALPGVVENVHDNGNNGGDRHHNVGDSYSSASSANPSYHQIAKPRSERDVSKLLNSAMEIDTKEIGLNRIISVVSTGDLAFHLTNETEDLPTFEELEGRIEGSEVICMSALSFASGVVVLISILVISCLFSVFLCLRQRALIEEGLGGKSGSGGSGSVTSSYIMSAFGCGNNGSSLPLSFHHPPVPSLPRKQAPPPPTCQA